MEDSNFEAKHEQLQIILEKAEIKDLGIIQGLNRQLCEKENNEFDGTINPDYAFTEKGSEYFKFRIESPDSFAMLARSGDTVVGYLVGGMVNPEDYRTVDLMAELENMYVQESMRGKGIGGKLIAEFENWCKERGVQRYRVVASAQNSGAIEFYKSHGAEEVSVTLERKF